MNVRDAIILTGKANRKQRKPEQEVKKALLKNKVLASDGALGIASIFQMSMPTKHMYNTKT